MNYPYFNKVNIITYSRIVLTLIGVLLIFSGNINLLIIAYVIMSLSEVSDIIDGYVARRDDLVTDLGKILDPLSDSISRFFYFFALAYHGLFPIWFIVFFFLRDIIVAYVRIFASFSGRVLSARMSGKIKGAVQFAGQYLLMFALMINTVQESTKPSFSFLFISLAAGILLNIAVLVYFRIKGGLLYTILCLMLVLGAMLFSLNFIDIYINYLTTFLISFVVISVTLYSLADYLLSLEPGIKSYYKALASLILIVMMYLISPYFLDLVKNKFESDAQSVNWISYDNIDIEDSPDLKIKGIVTVDSVIIAAAGSKRGDSFLYLLKSTGKGLEKISRMKLPDKMSNVRDIEHIYPNIYLIDDATNKVYVINEESLISGSEVKITGIYNTGFTSSATLGAVSFNGRNYLVINDYIFSGHLYFCRTAGLTEEDNLKEQSDFKIMSEFYVKSLYSEENELFVLVNKLNRDLIYKIDVEKAVLGGNIQNGIVKIYKSPDNDLQGVSILNSNIITYGSRSKKVYVTSNGEK